MDLKTLVKVASINNLSDARYFSGVGAQLVGFNFDKESSRYIETQNAFQIKDWLAQPEIVGEFSASHSIEQINSIAEKLNLNYVQVDDAYDWSSLKEINLPIIKRIAFYDAIDGADLKAKIEALGDKLSLIVMEVEEMDLIACKGLIAELASVCNIVLSSAIDKDNVDELLESLAIEGIEIASGDEIKTGHRSFDDVADLMEALELEF